MELGTLDILHCITDVLVDRVIEEVRGDSGERRERQSREQPGGVPAQGHA
jgi:hypothetical protein